MTTTQTICPDCEHQLASLGLARHRRGACCRALAACLRAEEAGYVEVPYSTEDGKAGAF